MKQEILFGQTDQRYSQSDNIKKRCEFCENCFELISVETSIFLEYTLDSIKSSENHCIL